MVRNGDKSAAMSEERTLEYQGRLPARKKVRVGYAIAAGICGLGGGVVLFGGVMRFIAERTRIPPSDSDGVGNLVSMGLIGALMVGTAVYFALKMVKDRGAKAK